MPGDVVRRLIKGKDTQRGYCRQVHVSASVQVVGTKFVIININSNSLTPLEVLYMSDVSPCNSYFYLYSSKYFIITQNYFSL